MKNVNISDLGDKEKSVLLARLVGWETSWNNPPRGQVFIYYNRPKSNCIQNLYDTKNMDFAWRVLNWAVDNMLESGADYHVYKLFKWNATPFLLSLPPDNAQRKWLDRILGVAIKYNMIDWGKLPFELPTA